MRCVNAIYLLAFAASAQKVPMQQLPQSYSPLPVLSRSFRSSVQNPASQFQYPSAQSYPLARNQGASSRYPYSSVGPLRATVKASGSPMVTLYKIEKGRCSQSTIEDGIGAIISKSVRGFKDGDCKSQGYTKKDGAKTTTMPVIGELEVLYFTQPPPSPPNPLQSIIDKFSGNADLAETSSGAVSAMLAGSIGFAVGSGVFLAVFHLRRETMAVGYAPLCA